MKLQSAQAIVRRALQRLRTTGLTTYGAAADEQQTLRQLGITGDLLRTFCEFLADEAQFAGAFLLRSLLQAQVTSGLTPSEVAAFIMRSFGTLGPGDEATPGNGFGDLPGGGPPPPSFRRPVKRAKKAAPAAIKRSKKGTAVKKSGRLARVKKVKTAALKKPHKAAKPQRSPARTTVEFRVFHPTEIATDNWYTLLAYLLEPTAEPAIDADSRARLNAQELEYKKARANATVNIKRGTEVTIVPLLHGCTFNPPTASVIWEEQWHCVPFRFKPSLPAEQAINGKVSFLVGPIVVAEAPIWAHVSKGSSKKSRNRKAVVKAYDAIFVSYSHTDAAIIDALEKAYTALGMTYLRDVRHLRSGQSWNPALLTMIDTADIFQLCWSKAAKTSQYVEQEWRRALRRRRVSFIRPVYWEQPMPSPPSELADLHFAYYDARS